MIDSSFLLKQEYWTGKIEHQATDIVVAIQVSKLMEALPSSIHGFQDFPVKYFHFSQSEGEKIMEKHTYIYFSRFHS